MTRWSLPAVERAAPDAASLTAGRRLAVPGPWSQTGTSDVLVWGRCQGSGRTPYQVSVDLAGPAYRCSCPSRKHPCKHALALLLLWARDALPTDGGGGEGGADGGADARAWALTRARRAADAEVASATPRRPVDEAARARRLEERLALMDAGVDDLARWLSDLVRGGTVQARGQSPAWWDDAAARLVDAQLPGLAEEVRTTGAQVRRREDWAEMLLADLGRWWSIVRAWQQRAHLDERTLADLRACVGWATPTDDVRAADAVDDHWHVLGAHRSDDGRLLQQRTWLRSVGTGETVLLLDHAARGAPLPAARLVGSVLDATLARYPGSPPRRALLATEPALVSTDADLPPGVGIDAALAALAQAWADDPWTTRVPVVLADARLLVDAGQVVDATGAALPLLPGEDRWGLLALTGGRPAAVFGELEAGGFRPLTVDLDPTGEAR